MTPEGKVKQEVKKVLAEYNCWYYMPVQTGYGVSGIPDFVGCCNGKFFAVECKAYGGKLTLAQEVNLRKIVACGGKTMTVYPGTKDLDGLRVMLEMLSAS